MSNGHMLAVKRIFRESQNCPPWRPKCDAEVKKKVTVMEIKMKALAAGKWPLNFALFHYSLTFKFTLLFHSFQPP